MVRQPPRFLIASLLKHWATRFAAVVALFCARCKEAAQPLFKKFMRCGGWLQSHTRYDGGMDQALARITERVRAAVASQTPLCASGAGAPRIFMAVALHGDVLDTRLLSGVTSYEPSELVITARAGTPLAELEAALAAKGQCLPFEPPHFSPAPPWAAWWRQACRAPRAPAWARCATMCWA